MSQLDEVVELVDFGNLDVKPSAKTNHKITKQNQLLAKFERQLSLLKMKERKRDTRRKIELGGLVIKAKMDGYPKSIILGALIDALEQLENNLGAELLFHSKGEAAFMGYGDQDNEPNN